MIAWRARCRITLVWVFVFFIAVAISATRRSCSYLSHMAVNWLSLRISDRLPKRGVVLALGDLVGGGARLHQGPGGGFLWEGIGHRAVLVAPVVVDGEAAGDGEQPGGEGVLRLVEGDLLVGRDEAGLGQFLSVARVGGLQAQELIELGLVAGDEDFERSNGTRLHLEGKFFVAEFLVSFWHPRLPAHGRRRVV